MSDQNNQTNDHGLTHPYIPFIDPNPWSTGGYTWICFNKN